MYSLSGGFSAGGRAGPVVVYVRRDEVGWGAATAGVGGSGGSLVPTVDLADSFHKGVAGCHSRLGVRGVTALPRCRLDPAEVRLRW